MKLDDGLFFPMIHPQRELSVEVESCQHFNANHHAGFDSAPWGRPREVVIFQYTISGEGRVQFDAIDIPQRRGDAFLIHTGPSHRYFLPEQSEEWRFASFTLRGETILHWAKRMIQTHGIHYRISLESPTLSAIAALFQRISREVMIDTYSLSAETYQLAMLLERDVVGETTPHLMHPKIQEAISYIHSNYRSKITLDDIAARCELSRFYFTRLFKDQTGSTVRDYLEQVRIQRAKQMLLDPTMAIADIAAEVGFTEQAYFANVFRERVSQTPSEYRRSTRIASGLDL